MGKRRAAFPAHEQNFPMSTLQTRIEQFQWYRRKHGVIRLAWLAFRKLINLWLFRSEYIFVISLRNELPVGLQTLKAVTAESYSSMETVPSAILEQICTAKSRGVALPFLQNYFQRGGRLWVGVDQGTVVGLRWSFNGSLWSFYSLPIPENDVILVASETFPPYRGRQYWHRFLVAVLGQLRAEGFARVYIKVHHRNRSMLRAVRKAGLSPMGRVVTFDLVGHDLTIWRKRYLFGASSTSL